MAGKKRTRGNPIPLVVEPHPEDYNGYPFITLIQYRNEHILSIVDNTTKKAIKAYVLDLCGPEKVDEEQIIQIASGWYKNKSERYPISFEFSREGVAHNTSKILRTFTIEYVTRIIGPLPKFEMSTVENVRRRRRKPIPEGVKINRNVIDL